jgi:NSS family neurotransmitter:Na+ symporter
VSALENAAPEPTRDSWTSPFAFLYACAGAAIGLGSLWRFPYVAGQNGGGAFVILFLAFIFLLCVPLMMAEMLIGKRGGGSAVLSVGNMIRGERAWGAWKSIGWLSILVPFVGLSYYSVVAGWGLQYIGVAVADGFHGYAGTSEAKFNALMGSPLRSGLLQGGFILAVAAVVALGVQRGIEWVSRVKMIGLFVAIIGLVAYGFATLDMNRALEFLFKPNWAALTPESVLEAFGQALFSTSVGVGVIMTYSAYLPRRMSLGQAAFAINGSVALVASLAGLAIFPAVFTYGLKPAGGPPLIFVTLPAAFDKMPGGQWVGLLFFVMIVLAAFTVAVGMLEPVVAWLKEKTRLGRGVLAFLTGAAIFAVGLPSLLSFSTLANFHPLAAVPQFAGKTFFDLVDFFLANILLPLNALLIALFVGWCVKRATVDEELSLKGVAELGWRLAVMIVAPVLVAVLMVSLIFPDAAKALLGHLLHRA